MLLKNEETSYNFIHAQITLHQLVKSQFWEQNILLETPFDTYTV